MSQNSSASDASPARGEGGVEGVRTRGGWIPVGTAADRRAAYQERGTDRGDRTRSALLAAARTVFERDGFFQANVGDIVAEANLARGSFYTYFESKMDVFNWLREEVRGTIQDAVTLEGDVRADPIENLRRSNERFLRVYADNALLYAQFKHVAAVDPDNREAWMAGRRRNIERVTTRIRRWQETGYARRDVDPQLTASALVAMTSDFCYAQHYFGQPIADPAVLETLQEIWIGTLDLRRTPSHATD